MIYTQAQHLSLQPDLNYRESDVRAEMTKVLEFYMKKGVAGFRLDAVS